MGTNSTERKITIDKPTTKLTAKRYKMILYYIGWHWSASWKKNDRNKSDKKENYPKKKLAPKTYQTHL